MQILKIGSTRKKTSWGIPFSLAPTTARMFCAALDQQTLSPMGDILWVELESVRQPAGTKQYSLAPEQYTKIWFWKPSADSLIINLGAPNSIQGREGRLFLLIRLYSILICSRFLAAKQWGAPGGGKTGEKFVVVHLHILWWYKAGWKLAKLLNYSQLSSLQFLPFYSHSVPSRSFCLQTDD